MNYKSSLAVAIIVLLFLGCSDNSTSPTLHKTFKFPLALGNKIIFTISEIDSQGKKKGFLFDVDSIVCDRQEMVDSKNAFLYYQLDSENNKYYVEKYALENNILYLHSDFIRSIVDDYYDDLGYTLPFIPTIKWLKFVDVNQSNWVVFDEEVVNHSLDDDDYYVTSGRLKMTASLIDSNIQCDVNGKSLSCIAYKYNFKYDGNVYYGYTSEMYGILQADLNIVQYFNEEVGKVRTLYLPGLILFGDRYAFKFGGYGAFAYKHVIN